MKYGDIWRVDYNPTKGQEINKIRPSIIVNHNSMGVLKLKVVIPITNGRVPKEWHVPLLPSARNGLLKPSIADCFQIKSVSQDRFVEKMGRLSQDDIDEVKITIMKVLDLI